MKREYISLFEKAAPRMSDEELFESVLAISSSRKGSITMKNNTQKSENKSKKFFSKAVVIPLAAALALGATAVGAVAVYNRSVADEYANTLGGHASKFPQEYKDKDGNKIDFGARTLADGTYDKLNITLDKTYEYDDFTIEFPGAIGSGDEIRVMFNIVFKGKPDLGEDDPEYYPQFCLENEGERTHIWWDNGAVGVYGERDGNLTYSNYIAAKRIGDNDTSVNFKASHLWSTNDKWNGNNKKDVDIDFDILITDEMRANYKTVDIANKPHVELGDWGDWNLDSVKITPFKVEFNLSTDGETPDPVVCKLFSPKIPVYMTFTDGSVLDIARYGGGSGGIDKENKTLKIVKSLNYPIDIDSVESIQFASAGVSMDGTVSEIAIEKIPLDGRTIEEILDPNNPANKQK